jgi:hypothetical protein
MMDTRGVPGAPSFPRPFAERVGSHTATLATAAETLWFHGQHAQAWFHQNCGRRTASPQEVWPPATAQGMELAQKPMLWLASRIDLYCTSNGAREWTAEISLADLTVALARAGLAHFGRDQVMGWLRTGLPTGALASLQ